MFITSLHAVWKVILNLYHHVLITEVLKTIDYIKHRYLPYIALNGFDTFHVVGKIMPQLEKLTVMMLSD